MTGVRTSQTLLAPWASPDGLKDCPLCGITMASSAVTDGGVFLAVAGSTAHGIEHVDEALANGARLVVWEPAPGVDPEAVRQRCGRAGVQAMAVPDLARHAGAIAARYYGDPADALRVIGVTGTDGKTSVAHYIAALFDHLGEPAALMGTLGWGPVGDLEADTLTTADAVTLQARFASLRKRGVHAVAMEVSSHALAQHRVDAVPFHTAVLTHVGRDHLDYHGSVEAYRAAKRRLFTWPGLRRQVLNLDDDLGAELTMAADAPGEKITYGRRSGAALQLVSTEPTGTGLTVTASIMGARRRLGLGLLGPFNALNALAALGAGPENPPTDRALEALAGLRPVPGRMERFIGPGQPLVVVDYAHTPGALRAALEGVRPHTRGRLVCVFGCGGDRDRGKRALMGEVATALADAVILTNDNPRSESPAAILADIEAGCRSGTPCRTQMDRRTAIHEALALAGADGTVLVAGKGHEDTQIVGEEVRHFSDREAVESLLTGEVT